MTWEHKEWLTLSEVAQMLGVHPSTVRIWANQGKIPVHRTNGGHRRFRRSELEIWMLSRDESLTTDIPQELIQAILRQVRARAEHGDFQKEEWYQKIGEEHRRHFREAGHQMVQHLWAYLVNDGESNAVEATSLGYEYASRARQIGLTECEALRSFMFFAQAMVDAVLEIAAKPQVQASPMWIALLRKINAFLQGVARGMFQTFDIYSKTNALSQPQP